MLSTTSLRRWSLMAAALAGLTAQAQSFPGDSSWVPLRCATDVMTDAFRDESGALGERDLVGDTSAATGYRAADGQYLYLRIRVEQDPLPGGSPRPFAWGLLLDLDGNLQNYEVLLLMNGIGGTVGIYKNTVTTLSNDPTDPPDEPAVKTYALSSNARSLEATGSSYGGNTDYFLDIAIPWKDLEPVGLTPYTKVTAWAATSSSSTTLNGDFACFNDATGNPTLSGTASGPTVLDPGVDSDGDGYTDATEYANGTDPRNASSHPSGTPDARLLAGGGGCAATSGMSALALALVAWTLLVRRRWAFARRR